MAFSTFTSFFRQPPKSAILRSSVLGCPHYLSHPPVENARISRNNLSMLPIHQALSVPRQTNVHFHIPCSRTQVGGSALVALRRQDDTTYIYYQTLGRGEMLYDLDERQWPTLPLLNHYYQMREPIEKMTIYRYAHAGQLTHHWQNVRTFNQHKSHQLLLSSEECDKHLMDEMDFYQTICRIPTRKVITLDSPNACIGDDEHQPSDLMLHLYPPSSTLYQRILAKSHVYNKLLRNTQWATNETPIWIMNKDDTTNLGTQQLMYCIAIYIYDNHGFRAMLHHLPPHSDQLNQWLSQITSGLGVNAASCRVLTIQNSFCINFSNEFEDSFYLAKIAKQQARDSLRHHGFTTIQEYAIPSSQPIISPTHQIIASDVKNTIAATLAKHVNPTSPQFNPGRLRMGQAAN